jgi:hypothetical protein
MMNPEDILRLIGANFVAARRKGRLGAYQELQTEIATHLQDLVPAVIPFKDAINLLTELDNEFLKSDGSSQGGLEALQKWLEAPAAPDDGDQEWKQ